MLVLGTALLVVWQPVGRLAWKASDAAFALGLALWSSSLLLRRADRRAASVLEPTLPALLLLACLVTSTLAGYWQYGLTMSRGGAVLLLRLATCTALFLAVVDLTSAHGTFGTRMALALLSPATLLFLLPVPPLFGRMWVQGRFQGLAVNPNTAALAFLVAFSFASTVGVYNVASKRPLRAATLIVAAAIMLVFIVWTQSRAYLGAACASALLGTVLVAGWLRMPRGPAVAATLVAFLALASLALAIAPKSLFASYLSRVSWGTLAPPQRDTQAPPPGSGNSPVPRGRQVLAWSSWLVARGRVVFIPGEYGALDVLERLRPAAVRRLMENPHIQAAILYAQLLRINPLGLGVNYDQKFFLYFPWINGKHHGTNSILDVPIYGGVCAVLAVALLIFRVTARTAARLRGEPDDEACCAVGATVAFAGIWVAAVFLGSPIFDYQFWIVSALALGPQGALGPGSSPRGGEQTGPRRGDGRVPHDRQGSPLAPSP
jgi:hypothetical protein